MVGLPKSAVHRILTENSETRKLFAGLVLRLFKMERKERREDVSIECLSMFHSNKADYLRRLITI